MPKSPRAVGASLPFVEHQAEDAVTDGTVIGPTWRQNELPVEASGRRAVALRQGQFVEFTLTEPANSALVRYRIPNTPDSSEYTVPLGLVVAGEVQPPLPLTNAYTWRYGEYQFTKDPADGKPQHFFDEAHRLLDEMPAGTKVRLEAKPPTKSPSTSPTSSSFHLQAALPRMRSRCSTLAPIRPVATTRCRASTRQWRTDGRRAGRCGSRPERSGSTAI